MATDVLLRCMAMRWRCRLYPIIFYQILFTNLSARNYITPLHFSLRMEFIRIECFENYAIGSQLFFSSLFGTQEHQACQTLTEFLHESNFRCIHDVSYREWFHIYQNRRKFSCFGEIKSWILIGSSEDWNRKYCNDFVCRSCSHPKYHNETILPVPFFFFGACREKNKRKREKKEEIRNIYTEISHTGKFILNGYSFYLKQSSFVTGLLCERTKDEMPKHTHTIELMKVKFKAITILFHFILTLMQLNTFVELNRTTA